MFFCRMDHLLGRNLIENLTVLRFSNLVFEPLWSRKYIRNVQVSIFFSLSRLYALLCALEIESLIFWVILCRLFYPRNWVWRVNQGNIDPSFHLANSNPAFVFSYSYPLEIPSCAGILMIMESSESWFIVISFKW